VSSSTVVITMYTIGEFAALGRVSARMLRHYDAIGLLVPAEIDARTGYRRYAPWQLSPLLRIAQLRDLGCGLDDAADVLRAPDESAALIRVLERHRLALTASIAAESARLARVDEQLRYLIEGERKMTDVQYRPIAAVTVYAASGVAAGGEGIPDVIGRILPALQQALDAARADYREPGVFWYEPVEGTEDMRVWVSWVAGGAPATGADWEVVALPAVSRAAVTRYHGDMSGIGGAWHQFMQDIVADGGAFRGACREVYVQAEGPQSTWVTELQQPLA